MASFEAYEIQRQARALNDQTSSYQRNCEHLVELFKTLASELKGTELETIINRYSDDYQTIGTELCKKYYDLANVMDTWAESTISTELETDELLKKYRQQLDEMLEVIGSSSPIPRVVQPTSVGKPVFGTHPVTSTNPLIGGASLSKLS